MIVARGRSFIIRKPSVTGIPTKIISYLWMHPETNEKGVRIMMRWLSKTEMPDAVTLKKFKDVYLLESSIALVDTTLEKILKTLFE